MAIGKVNAYATVEAPKVDFGDIALNAQKIQQADLDRMKDMIPKPEKPKEIKPWSVDEKTSTIGTVENIGLKISQQARDGYYQAKLSGDEALASRYEGVVKRFNSYKEAMKAGIDSFDKDFKEGKISPIEKDRISFINDLRNGRNSSARVEENGTIYYYGLSKDGDKILLDENGNEKKKQLKLPDGKTVDELSEDGMLQYWVDYIPNNDIGKETELFAKRTGAYQSEIERGDTTISKKYYTDKNLKNLRDSIQAKLASDEKYFKDIWYKSNPSKNTEIKEFKDYTKEDFEEATNFLYNETRRQFDSSYSETKDEPKQEGDGKNKNKIFTTPITIDDAILYDGKLKQKFSKDNFNNNVIGLTGFKPYNTPGLGFNIPEFIAYDKKHKQIVIGGSVVTDTNIRFTRKDGTTQDISKIDFNTLDSEEQDQFVQSTFGNKDKTTTYLRQPTAAMKARILQATNFRNWDELERSFSGSSSNQGGASRFNKK